MDEVAEKARRALLLKSEIEERQKELRTIQSYMADAAVFPPEKDTASIEAGDVTVKVARKSVDRWDQSKLAAARTALGDEKFFGLFGCEFKPRGRKELKGFLRYADEKSKRPVIDALTVVVSYSVTFDPAEKDHV